MSRNSRRRFPVDQRKCNRCVGSLLQHRIGQILKEMGFRTEITKVEKNGVDLKLYNNNERNPILVGEILNWSLYSELPSSRKNSIIKNLSQHSCKKLVIYTTMKNEIVLDDLNLYGISLLKLDYQLLPEYFYNHYARRGKTESRRVDSRQTRQDIKAKIANFLRSSDIKIPVPPLERSSLQLQTCSKILQEVIR